MDLGASPVFDIELAMLSAIQIISDFQWLHMKFTNFGVSIIRNSYALKFLVNFKPTK